MLYKILKAIKALKNKINFFVSKSNAFNFLFSLIIPLPWPSFLFHFNLFELLSKIFRHYRGQLLAQCLSLSNPLLSLLPSTRYLQLLVLRYNL